MTTKTYDVLVRVPASKLATIIETLDGEGELLSVQASAYGAKKPRNRPFVRLKNGTTGANLLLECTKDGKDTSYEHIVAKFVAHGFARNSASPAIFNAIKAGKLTQVRKGVYKLTGA